MIKFTPAKEEDIDAVTAIAKESFSDPWTRDSFLSALGNIDNIFLCAAENGEVIGYIIGSATDEYAEADSIGVSPAHRRKGIATALLKIFEARAAEKNISDKLSLEVRESNAAAIKFYEKNGFGKIGIRKNFYVDPRENAVIMAKKLSAPECRSKRKEI